MITIKQAFESWQEIAETIPADDLPMLAESWSCYTDSLCKDGELTDLQYNYCPAHDEEMPEDDHEYILNCLGVKLSTSTRQTGARPDGIGDWPPGAMHYHCRLNRDGAPGAGFSFWYTTGPAIKYPPVACDVLASLLLDASCVESCDDEWDMAEETGFDICDRESHQQAVRTFRACKVTARNLKRMFGKDTLEQLQELFADY